MSDCTACAIRRPSGDKPTQNHRSIFLSDMHLGTRLSRASLILDFLRTHDAETVYLVGDIVDNWHPLSGNWKPEHHDVLRWFLDLPRTGTRVIYVPGNHDDFFPGDCVLRRRHLQHLVLEEEEGSNMTLASPNDQLVRRTDAAARPDR